MSIKGELRQKAHEIALQFQQRASHLQKEYLEAQARADELKAQLETANLAPEREFNFPGIEGHDRLCPRCWVQKGKKVTLSELPSSDREDLYACGECGLNLSLTSGTGRV